MNMITTMTNEAKVLTGIVVATIMLVIGAVFFLSQPEKQVIIDPALLVKADSNKIATDSARVTIVEFGDYECPACGLAYPGLKEALAAYPNDVNFVYRHYPLMQHPNAEIAGRAAEAAGMQGKYWEMHNTLFEKQEEWSKGGNALESFKGYASGLGLDVERFSADINSDPAKNKVANDLADGLSLGVNSTPSFFINNEPYKGGFGFQDFKGAIEAKLGTN